MDGEDPGSLGHSRLGTPAVIDRPLGRRRPFTVVSCSRMVPLKRVDLVARALPRVEGEVRWIHLGDGPAREAVEEICRHLPERIDVDLRGQVPNPEVLECYRASRPSVFVNVSTFEGLPVSIMEAMSAGIPVIATDVGGVSEIVRDGENGRLLAGDPSPADVGEALGDVAGMSDEDYRRHARLAWETWRRSFHAEENFGEFLRTILAAPTADRGPGPA